MFNYSDVVRAGGLFFASHSGGKDSQAMYAHMIDIGIPVDQIIVVHAHLGEIEWDGIQGHIDETIMHDLNTVQAVTRDGEPNDFLKMVAKRGMWPSPTSDLKRGPIYKFIRRVMKERGATLAVNCTGMRAEESPARAKKQPWSENKTLSKAGRTVYEWMPIHSWSVDQVFDKIYAAGQKPFHAYGKRGELNQRLSCVFCIMGSVNDHRHGAQQRPELYAKIIQMEKSMCHTMFPGKSIEERNSLPLINVQPTTPNT